MKNLAECGGDKMMLQKTTVKKEKEMEELGVEMVEKGKRRKGKRDGRTEYVMGVEKKKRK